jgi:uncharacterized membrane protein YbhN (UPF0104 family)
MSRLRLIFEPILVIILLALAALALHHLLKQYSWAQILHSMHKLTKRQLAVAGLLTCLGYFTLTFYDVLGLHHLNKKVGYPRVFIAALCAFTAGHNLGFTPLTSLPIRYKFYQPVGLSAVDVTELFAFTSLTFGIGFLVVGGLTLSFQSLPVPRVIHLPLRTLHPLGWLMLGLLVAYVVACALVRRPLTIRGRKFRLPGWRVAILQIILSSIDWSIAGCVLYVLLPSHAHLSYLRFMGVYSLAMICGSSSHVPGGLGIFETIIMVLLSSTAPGSAIIAALLAYRVVFSIFPLLVTLVLLGAFVGVRLIRQRHRARRALPAIGP